MACNCKKKANVPQKDPVEESFRMAYIAESKKTARLAAENTEYKNIIAKQALIIAELSKNG